MEDGHGGMESAMPAEFIDEFRRMQAQLDDFQVGEGGALIPRRQLLPFTGIVRCHLQNKRGEAE
jgi:hypothetical protein